MNFTSIFCFCKVCTISSVSVVMLVYMNVFPLLSDLTALSESVNTAICLTLCRSNIVWMYSRAAFIANSSAVETDIFVGILKLLSAPYAGK